MYWEWGRKAEEADWTANWPMTVTVREPVNRGNFYDRNALTVPMVGRPVEIDTC